MIRSLRRLTEQPQGIGEQKVAPDGLAAVADRIAPLNQRRTRIGEFRKVG